MAETRKDPSLKEEFESLQQQLLAWGYHYAVGDACSFDANTFNHVMDNLIRNPNITSSHVFRADIFWDSEKDSSFDVSLDGRIQSSFLPHIKADLSPRELGKFDGLLLRRTVVRQFVPRNPKLDRSLVQTCHFYSSMNDALQSSLVIFLPHVDSAEEMPWYHPNVKILAFLFTRTDIDTKETASSITNSFGQLSIHFCPFASLTVDLVPSDTRLERTLKSLLSTILKHGQGVLQGYEKHGKHDNIIPQARLQDTYARLKGLYAKRILNLWKEQTDATKGVFEDIGIAAFLVEVWDDMYTKKRIPFPGFVDIACGNGVLVYILIEEGYQGWGFDARARKTWLEFPEKVRSCIQTRILVPRVFESYGGVDAFDMPTHDGIFSDKTFIISNHADELTMWTPLIAYLSNDTPFIAIPCCSHDLTGGKTRFSEAKQPSGENASVSQPVKRQPSAYSSLCSTVSRLTQTMGYAPETEMLRIPSTRNVAILGRSKHIEELRDASLSPAERLDKVLGIVAIETGKSVAEAARLWNERVRKLLESKGRNH